MSGISTHVLDMALGKPAAGVRIRLDLSIGENWEPFASGITDLDGRCSQLVPSASVESGKYRITFDTGMYFGEQGKLTLYPEVVVIFLVTADTGNYHIPLLLSPFGFTTYRGS